ncbi:mitochondrial DNA polymerase I protein D, partial [Strigomonas culicis]
MLRRRILPLFSFGIAWTVPVLSRRAQATYSPPANSSTPAPSSGEKELTLPGAKATAATPHSYAPFPARQNPFSSVLYQDEEKVLLAKSHYCLFTLSMDPASGKCAVYCATTNELIVSKMDSLWKCAMWVDEKVGDEFLAGLVFPEGPGSDVKAAAKTLSEKSNKRIVVAPDAWGITYLAFRAQQEVVRGVEAPKSLEHASFLLTNKQYDASIADPAVFNIETGAFETQKLTNRFGPGRSALLIWNVLFNVHKRFGTPGSRKTLNPVDQIIRRVVKAVNIFVVDINVRVGKGTISEGHTMIVTIYDVQKRTQSVHMIRSLAEETTKLNTLTTLLYGEGSSSISLFVPTAKTKSSQLVAFARTCRPKSPFFVTEITSLGPYFSGLPIAKDTVNATDPRTTWTTMRNNCFKDQKHTRKDDDKMDRFLQRGFTALANKLFSDRLHKVSSAIISAHNSVPQQTSADQAFKEVEFLAEDAKKNPVASITSSTFLNKVNINDAEVVFGLQQWKSKIYDNKARLEREKKVVDSLRRYLVVDLETTTVRRYKRIANPFTKENFVVLSGARDYQGNVFMPRRYFDRNVALRYDDASVASDVFLVEKSSKLSLFLPPLDDYDVLVGHNIKFDLLQIWRDAELRKFLSRGGKIWDTMYGEYLLTGHDIKLGHGAGLEDVAKSYGGQIPKLDAVKRAWAEGQETYEIPYATLTEYLHGDLENTELIFRKHMERALAQRQAIIVSARMDGLLCTTEMEYNGLKTNVELAQRQSNELVSKVTEYRNVLQAAVPAEIPPDCRKFFNWSSNQHLITFFFGGKLKLATNARPSKPLPGEPFARHELFLPPGSFPPESYPNGVFLRPPVYVLGIGDCAVMSGSTSEKGTRMFKAYFDAYMKQANFRKSSTMLDCLQREMVSIPRSDTSRKGEVSALANLLPRRHLFLLAAISLGAEGEIVKLFVKNPITGESTTITSEKKGAPLEQFIAAQVEKHTEMILPVDEELSYENAAFVDAQVTIMARDAPFSFHNAVQKDETLSSFIEAHSESNRDTDIKNRYTVCLADTVPVLTFYKHMYPAQGASGKTKERATPVVPLKALSSSGKLAKSKKTLADDYVKKLRQEDSMKPEEWCTYYA